MDDLRTKNVNLAITVPRALCMFDSISAREEPTTREEAQVNRVSALLVKQELTVHLEVESHSVVHQVSIVLKALSLT